MRLYTVQYLRKIVFLAVGLAIGLGTLIWIRGTSSGPPIRTLQNSTVISAEGATLRAIYDGVKPSAYWLRRINGRRTNQRTACGSSVSLASLAPAAGISLRRVQGCQSDTVCAGHYVYLYHATCGNGAPCLPSNFTFSALSEWSDGENDHWIAECQCCWTAVACENDN
jgi:hypothetical protein